MKEPLTSKKKLKTKKRCATIMGLGFLFFLVLDSDPEIITKTQFFSVLAFIIAYIDYRIEKLRFDIHGRCK